MTLEEFRASKKRMTSNEFCDHIKSDRDMIAADHVLTYGPGNGLYIEDADEQGRYYLIMYRDEYFETDLAKLEAKLYEFAVDEGYISEEAQ